MINVLVVDDHDLVRTGLRMILQDAPGIKVIAEAKTGEEAIILVQEHNPDVVLMDVKMPGIGGLEATRKLLLKDQEIKILIITVYDNEIFPLRLMQAGAVGYLTKDASMEEMVKAIRTVHEGGRFISPQIAQHLAVRHLTDTSAVPLEVLSPRELQVMLLIAKGMKSNEIANKLNVAAKTVSTYRSRIQEKLGVRNDVELTHTALRYDMLNDEDL